MKNLIKAISLLSPAEKKSGIWLLPLFFLRGFADMLGVALVFPLLNIMSNPEVITTNTYLAWIYDFGGFQSAETFVMFAGLSFVIVLVLTAALKISTVYVVNCWLENQVHSLSSRLLETYLRQPYEFSLSRHSSELITNMFSEVTRVVYDVFKPITDVMVAAVTLLLMIAMLLVVDPTITLLAISVLGGMYFVMFFLVRKLATRLGAEMLVMNRKRQRIAWEAMGAAKQVRLLNREKSLFQSFLPPSRGLAQTSAKTRLVRQTPRYVIEVVAIGGTVLLALAMISKSGGVSSATMASIVPLLGLFVLAGYRMMPAFQNGYLSVVSLRVGSAALESINKDLQQAPELPELVNAQIKPLPLEKEIRLENVTYTYPGADAPSLRNINMTIPAGSSVGIVGQTGAGKSTLMDLLLGLLLPTEGALLIDGEKMGIDQIRRWRSNVGYVPQDVFLSDASISENIAFGTPSEEIDQDQVHRVAAMAQIAEFIQKELSEGYDTEVGERGVRLSGGQRQRISIARALYSEPKVIAFDEATSALDNATEAEVMAQIADLAGTRTLVMVAHRLTTVRDCDVIFMLEAGEIKKTGTYADLFQTDTSGLSLVQGGI